MDFKDGFAISPARIKANKEERKKLTRVMETLEPEKDWQEMSLSDLRAEWDAYQMIQGGRKLRKELRKMNTDIKHTQQQTKESEARGGVYAAQADAMTGGETRAQGAYDQSQAEQARIAGFIQRDAEMAKSAAPMLLNNEAYKHYQAIQNNPMRKMAAEVWNATGGMTPMGFYETMAPPAPAQSPTFTQGPGGITAVSQGNNLQVVRPEATQQDRLSADEKMLQAIQEAYNADPARAIMLLSKLKAGMMSESDLPQAGTAAATPMQVGPSAIQTLNADALGF